MRKYYLIAELLMFKYRWQINYCSHLSGSDVMLTQSTVSINNKRGIFRGRSCFNWSADTGEMVWCKQSWPEPGRLPDLGEAAGAYCSRNHDVDQLKLPLSEEWEHFHQVFVNVMISHWVYTSSSFHSCTQRTFWTQTLVVFDICTDVQISIQ